MQYQHDMTMMLSMHSALRRELDRIHRLVAHPGDDPREAVRTALGWQLFKSYLQLHHGVEDDILWPALRLSLGPDSDGSALLDAMEAEHARIDPLLDAIDRAVTSRHSGEAPLGELTTELETALRSHLDHEEHEGLRLIDATVSAEVWGAFLGEHAKRLGPDGPRFFGWVFDGVTAAETDTTLGQFPSPVKQSYHSTWAPAFAQLTIWPPAANVTKER